ncbi:MAG: hypothetical protein U0136_13515 [Bdellovibrionota bacterium]
MISYLGSLVVQISTAEFFLLLQTLILGGTGLIVYVYTKDTQLLREAAQFQTSLLAKDLDSRKATSEEQKQREDRANRAVLTAAGAIFHASEGRASLKFKNVGALARQIEVTTDPPVEALISPQHVLAPDQEGTITLRWVGPEQQKLEIPITFSYTDGNNQRQHQKLKWKAGGNLEDAEG